MNEQVKRNRGRFPDDFVLQLTASEEEEVVAKCGHLVKLKCVPTQIDYADYCEISGVKMPFRWTTTWTDGQTTIELSEVQPNIPIDAAKFGRPAPARPKSQ